jgi:hypothetical protein
MTTVPLNFVIVLDNAAYHNDIQKKTLSFIPTRIKMTEWLAERRITFNFSILTIKSNVRCPHKIA